MNRNIFTSNRIRVLKAIINNEYPSDVNYLHVILENMAKTQIRSALKWLCYHEFIIRKLYYDAIHYHYSVTEKGINISKELK